MTSSRIPRALITSAFLSSVGLLLAITAISKSISSFGKDRILQHFDTLIPVQNWLLLQLVSAIECAVIIILISRCRTKIKLASVLWLSTLFALYRLGQHLMATSQTCPCLGSLSALLPIKPSTLSTMFMWVTIYMLVGSVTLLLVEWRKNSALPQIRSGSLSFPALFLVVALICGNSRGFGALIVNGTVETTFFKEGIVANQYARAFKLTSDGCEFRIRAEPGREDRGIQYIECGADGTNLITLTKHRTATPVNTIARVFPQLIPPPNSEFIIVPWLAFASGCYLSNRPNEAIHCIWVNQDPRLVAHEEFMQLNAVWRFGEHSKEFVETLTDFRNGSIVDAHGEARSLPPDFADGHTNNHYEVLSWTNIGTRTFPTEFVLSSYGRTSDKRPVIVLRRRGTVRDIQFGDHPGSYMPELPSPVSVIDRRVRDERGVQVQYVTKERRLLEAHEVLAKERGPDTEAGNVASTDPRRIFLYLLLIVGAIPVIFAVSRFWRRVGKQKTKAK